MEVDAGCPHHDTSVDAACAAAAMEADVDGWLATGMRQAGLSFLLRWKGIYRKFSQFKHKPTCGVLVNESRLEALGPRFKSLWVRIFAHFSDLLIGQ
jgi:hypothetical protein